MDQVAEACVESMLRGACVSSGASLMVSVLVIAGSMVFQLPQIIEILRKRSAAFNLACIAIACHGAPW